MGTEVINWSERLASSAKEVAALERPSLSVLAVRAGVLSYMGQPVPGNKLQVVIIASAFQNRYYDKPFDPNNPANPVCFSLSLTGEDMVPDEESVDKQNPDCATCPNFAWGSDPKGGRGKACKSARRLTVIPASVLGTQQKEEPVEAITKAEMALLTLPVTSAKNWANYVNAVASSYQRPPWAVITEVSVVPDVKTQFQVKFDTVGIIGEEKLGALNARIEGAQKVLMTPYEEQPEAPAKAAPKEGRKY